MATRSEYITPGFDCEMLPLSPKNARANETSANYPSLIEDESYATLIENDALTEHQLIPEEAPREYFSVLPTQWKRSRGLSPWAVAEIKDNLGEVIYEPRMSSVIRPECRMVEKKTGVIPYTASPNGVFDWKNPFNIFVGGGEVNKLTPPYAIFNRTLTVPGAKMDVTFPAGDAPLEIIGNWNKREFSITRGEDVVATIRRRKLNTFEYTIEAGENIPFVVLIIEIIAILIARDR